MLTAFAGPRVLDDLPSVLQTSALTPERSAAADRELREVLLREAGKDHPRFAPYRKRRLQLGKLVVGGSRDEVSAKVGNYRPEFISALLQQRERLYAERDVLAGQLALVHRRLNDALGFDGEYEGPAFGDDMLGSDAEAE